MKILFSAREYTIWGKPQLKFERVKMRVCVMDVDWRTNNYNIIFTYFTQIVVLAKKFLNLEPHVNEPHTTSTKLIFE